MKLNFLFKLIYNQTHGLVKIRMWLCNERSQTDRNVDDLG